MSGDLPKVLVVSLGGTITMVSGSGPGIVPKLTADDLVAAVPGLDRIATIRTNAFLGKPSASLLLDDLLALAAMLKDAFAQGIDGAVVTQGTDTIEETAFALDLLVGGDAPIVVTGAMRGASAAGADGPANVLAATIVAADPAARGRGTMVVFNDEIHAARFVQKMHTALPSAFQSPGAGPIGLVAEGSPRFFSAMPRAAHLPEPFAPEDAPVALLHCGLGDDLRLLPALPGLGYRGLVIQAMGAGHLPDRTVAEVAALASGMPVVLASRVAAGPVFRKTYGFAGSEIDLLGRGLISAGTLSGAKARMLLMLALRRGLDTAQIASLFAAPYPDAG